jgi:hypothetical protein
VERDGRCFQQETRTELHCTGLQGSKLGNGTADEHSGTLMRACNEPQGEQRGIRLGLKKTWNAAHCVVLFWTMKSRGKPH